MISNKARWRNKDVTILGRGTGALSHQLRVSYLSKGGRTQFRSVQEHEVTILGPSSNDVAAMMLAANKRKDFGELSRTATNLLSRPGWDDVIPKRTSTKN